MTSHICTGKRVWIAAIASIALASVCRGQTAPLAKGVLTNRDVVTLANAGFSEKFILDTIAASSTKFELTADALADLAKSGITEEIIRAMRNPGEKSAAQVPGQTASRVFLETASQLNSQAAEVTKSFEQCPGFIVTNRQEEATFAVTLERVPRFFQRVERIAVFDRSGDAIFAVSTDDLRSAVHNFCQAAQIAKGIAAAH